MILPLVQSLPDQWYTKLFALLFTFLGGLGGVVLIYRAITNFVLRKRNTLSKIQQLAAGTTIGYFSERLGSPAFINDYGDRKRLTYVQPDFYVGAITDAHDLVIMFSVTTRSGRFNPVLGLGPYTTDRKKKIKISLGKTSFADVDILGTSGKVSMGAGARRGFYVEEYYFGNPGLYQNYCLSLIDAGYHNSSNSTGLNFNTPDIDSTTDLRLQEFRKSTVINTYTIVGPLMTEPIAAGIDFGVDLDQVRVLNR